VCRNLRRLHLITHDRWEACRRIFEIADIQRGSASFLESEE
jgi:hypothetical protein